jgi:tRNA (mo5U34)-methyltransferase
MNALWMSLKNVLRGLARRRLEARLPFDGYAERRAPTKFVDLLSDGELRELNALLKWNAFTVDARGRRFGSVAWGGKRMEPQVVPDPRILLMDKTFGLAGKHVLEVGCFEGLHTVTLCALAGRVTAVDARVENVVKTLVRCGFSGRQAEVFVCDVEKRPLDAALLSADFGHHVGVLYHLKDPAGHLRELGRLLRGGLMLDTHYALDGEAVETYVSDGREFKYKRYAESGKADVFSGMYDHAKWLRLDDIASVLKEAGFGAVDVVETRRERNGPRALLMARKKGA